MGYPFGKHLGYKTDTEATGDGSLIAILKRIRTLLSGAKGQTIKRAAISAASSGDNTLVAAVTGKKIKVLGMLLVVSGDVDVRLESGAGGTALTGVISLAKDGNGFVLPVASVGAHWVETAAAALLNLELSGAVQASGVVIYHEEA